MSEISSKPYLIRALYEWCVDNQHTPYLTVLVDENTQVPLKFVFNGQIVLNISHDAVAHLQIGNDYVECKACFDGKRFDIVVPVNNIIAIYSKENGQGMTFNAVVSSKETMSSLVLSDLNKKNNPNKPPDLNIAPIIQTGDNQTNFTNQQKIDTNENEKKSNSKTHLKLIK